MKILDLVAQISTTATEATATFGSEAVWLGLVVLVLVLLLLAGVAWFRSWDWTAPPDGLRGLALPRGSVRAILAVLIVGGFILFAFIGGDIVDDGEQFTAILGAWITLTAAVTGFYFGSRTGQTLDTPPPDADEEVPDKEEVTAADQEEE